MTAEHWESVYGTKDVTEVSWYQPEPGRSLQLIDRAVPGARSVVDVGGGASHLVDRLAARGVEVTVVDIAGEALAIVRRRLDDAGLAATLVASDMLAWEPSATFDVWHDRAALHFVSEPEQRARYAEKALAAVRPGGALVLAAFAPDGPTHCSGLPVQRRGPEEFAAEFAAGATLEHAEREEHHTPSGGSQAFTWVILRRG